MNRKLKMSKRKPAFRMLKVNPELIKRHFIAVQTTGGKILLIFV